MEVLAEIQAVPFWYGLITVVWVNVVLSADNAVVIALAVRLLPEHQRNKAVAWGAVAIVATRIALTSVTVTALTFPFLRIIGALLLLWIAVKLLMPGEDDEEVESDDNLYHSIKTIVVADLVMSLDNVIAVAAAAKGSISLLTLGLATSIPLVIFGAALLMNLMERFPVIITIGAALLGWVAGEMLVTDPYFVGWVTANLPWLEIHLPFGLEVNWAQIIGAAFVIGCGKWLASRRHERGAKSGRG